MKEIIIKIKRIRDSKDIPLPTYMSDWASGMDLFADIDTPLEIKPFERVLVPTGFIFEIPKGYEAEIRPRSGLAIKYGITVLNSPGTIDADYRGEVKIILINLSDKPYVVNRGDRIAQMVIKEVVRANVLITDVLEETKRNSGGFGHTGF